MLIRFLSEALKARIDPVRKLMSKKYNSAQTTVEYIFVLMTLSAVALFFYRTALKPYIQDDLLPAIESAIENQTFSGPDYRDFPLGRP
jgi:hypothetical protein